MHSVDTLRRNNVFIVTAFQRKNRPISRLKGYTFSGKFIFLIL